MYTRQQLAQQLGVSLSTVRRLLQKTFSQPCKVQYNSKNLPVYFYQEDVKTRIQRYVHQRTLQVHNQLKSCSVCKRKVLKTQLIGTRCLQCYVKRASMPLLFGDKPWKKLLNTQIVRRAVSYLQSFIHPTKSATSSDDT